MKLILIWMFGVGIPMFTIGQSSILKSTFYDLPINASRKKIKTQIISDTRFAERPDSDTSFFSSFNQSYYGTITVDDSLPFKIDSATIELTWGYGMFTKSKSKRHDLTFIKLNYFVADSATSHAFAAELWNRHKHLSSDTFDITVGRREDNNFSYGKKVCLKPKKHLPSLSILQQERNNNVFVVEVEYERFGE